MTALSVSASCAWIHKGADTKRKAKTIEEPFAEKGPEIVAIHESVIDTIDISCPEFQRGLHNAILKAEQLVNIQWTPKGYIPKTTVYIPGKTYKGIPYSSAKELDKFVGQEVSFYTFISAVNNPRSVLYTESISEPPYHGMNCTAYYGTVCSMSVNWALGIDAPFASNSYKKQSFMKRITDNDISLIEAGDVLASEGHSIMITGYEKEQGIVSKVHYFENSSFKTVSGKEFFEYWQKGHFVLYRYRNMADNAFIPMDIPSDNQPVCVSRGDRSIYKVGEDVTVNILREGYKTIHIYRDSELIDIRGIDSEDVVLKNLSKSMYKVVLTEENGDSASTQFEVRFTGIKCKRISDSLMVSFPDVSIRATGAELCDIAGQHIFTKLVDSTENAHLCVMMPYVQLDSSYYCKVIFQGKYGKIASEKMRVD